MGDSLKDKAINGATWKFLERTANQLMQFGVGIVLARLLDPSDYGIVGLLAIFFALATTLLDSGFGSALIQKKNRTENDYSTVFVFNILSSVIIYLLLFGLAPFIASFFQTPLLKDITRVAALTFIINGFTSVQLAKLNIDLKFKIISKISILGQVVTGITGVLLAYMGYGVWALVFQGLVSSFVVAVVIWTCSGWRPKLKFYKNSFVSLFKFGGNMLVSGIINTLYNNMYTLVIGKVFSPKEVGLYNRANSYSSLPANLIMDMAVSVNFPILSKLQDDNERLLNAYEKLLKMPYYILCPILVFLIVMAEPLIKIMIGEKWLLCVPYIQILCIGYMFYPLNALNMNLLYVKGYSKLALKIEFIKKPIGFIFLILSIPFGIFWMMVGKAAYSLIVYVINCHFTDRILSYGFGKQIRILYPIYLNSFLMGITLWICTSFIDSDIFKLLVSIPFCLILYVLVSYFRNDDELANIVNIIKNKTNA